jgi:hypothetical protein
MSVITTVVYNVGVFAWKWYYLGFNFGVCLRDWQLTTECGGGGYVVTCTLCVQIVCFMIHV